MKNSLLIPFFSTKKGSVALLGFLLTWALFVGPASGLESASGDLSYMRLSPAAADELARMGLEPLRSFDYGNYHWVGLLAEDLATAIDSGLGHAADFALRLGEQSFDPRFGVPALADGWSGLEGGDQLHLVQLLGPTRVEWIEQLEARGLELVQYIHPFTYVVWGEVGEGLVAEADFVRWTGRFEPAYRVLPRWRELNGELLDIDVLLYRGADLDSAVRALEAAGAELVGRSHLDHRFELVGVRIAGNRLREAARAPGVYSIQPEPQDGGLRGEMSNQVNANNVDGANSAFPGYEAWLTSIGLSGAGVVMANVDGGVQQTHPDLAGRMLPCTGTTCSGGASSHGTHTAGIMAGDGASGVTDSFGFLRGLGMAPGAQLFEQVYSPFFTQPGGMLLLISDSAANGAVLSGNSWGPAGSPRGYDNDTMQVDMGIRDALSGTSGNQPFTYVLSFMNGNGGVSSQGTPDEAKNLFNIGSTKMQSSSGTQILDIDDLSSNSAHGPALDGRTIPHMVAPGCRVDSTDTNSSGYGLKCGTSMASPHVAGAVGLFFEHYRALVGSDPSPALVKAAFLPVARDLAGNLDADGGVLGHPFDSKQGWGRMDVPAVLDSALPVLYFDDPVIFDNSGEAWSQTVMPADPGQPVRLMLVWTDAPGHGLGGSTPAWNNDLDLVVEAGADTYLGNHFDANGWSVTGGVADDRNNTEGLFLGPTSPAALTVRVTAANISSDAIPGVGDGTDQDFALACYNCTLGSVTPLFADGFESGDTSAWSVTKP